MLTDRYYIKTRCHSCNRGRKLILGALVFAVVFCPAGNALAQTVVRHLPRPYEQPGPSDRTVIEFEIVTGPTDTKAAHITDITGPPHGARPGEPLLTYSVVRVLLPPDAHTDSLQVGLTDTVWQDLPGQYEIPPAPPAATWSMGRYVFDWGQKDPSLIVQGRDTSVYSQNEFFPKEPVEIVSVGMFRRLKFARLRIWTSAYNPVQKRLRVLTHATATVSVAPAAGEGEPVRESDFVPNMLSDTLNAADFDKFYQPPAAAAGPSTDYVIITTSTIRDTSTKLAAFIVCKENCGHTVKVVTQAAVADDTHYISGATADERADNIRHWLQSHYLTDGIEYVLLIGDPDPAIFNSSESIPMKMCYPRHGAGDGYEEAPSDMFFAELSNTWDYDGDGYYGEFNGDYRSGGADQNCELQVGRIPFYGFYNDLDAVLQKTINYHAESGDRSWRQKALIAAAVANFGPQDNNGDGDADDPDDFPSASDRTFGADWGEEIKSLASSEGLGSYTLYEKEGVYSDGSAYSLTDCNTPLTVTNLVDEWQNQYGFVTWWAHGNNSVVYRLCWKNDSAYPNITGNYAPHDETLWYELFETAYCSQLDNAHPSFIVPVSCQVAHPEDLNNLAHCLLKNGAIGTFAGTRVTWYMAGSWNTGLGPLVGDDASYGYYIFSRIAQDDTAAAALNWCRSNFGTGWTAGASWMNMVATNLYGDPAISMTTDCLASTPPDANSVTVCTTMNTPVTIGLQAKDDSLPDPPATISYIITKVPGQGTLTDSQGAQIDTPGYELPNNENEVIYTPLRGYVGPDEFDFIANDGGLSPTGGDSNEATVSINVVEYFTELFDAQNNDLANRTFTFIPDGSPCFYRLCRANNAGFPIDPNGHTPLALGDDDAVLITLTDGKQVGVYGYTFDSFWIGGNGYITFDTRDIYFNESLSYHFTTKRISALFDDLDPSAAGRISWKQLPDRAVVTFLNVPEVGIANSNTFQIEMFFQGTIRITYLNIDAADGLAGLSDGNSLPPDFVQTDLTSFAFCADIDDDTYVNMADLELLALGWLDNNCSTTTWCYGTDINCDSQVDNADFANLSAHWLVRETLVELQETFTSIGDHDGRVYDNGAGTGEGANSEGSDGGALRLGDHAYDKGYRTVVSFDTSFIPDDAVILSARLQLSRGLAYGQDPFEWAGSCLIDVANPYFGPGEDLNAEDWNAPADAVAVASFEADPGMNNPMLSTGFNADGRININKYGLTQMRIRFETPISFNGVSDYLGFYSGEYVTDDYRPKLIVTYETITPTLAFYSTADEDGRVYDDGDGEAGAGANTGNAGDDSVRLGDYTGGESYRIILSFDTSTIPEDYVIQAVRLQMTRGAEDGQDPFGWGGACNIDIANPSFGNVALEASDWQAEADGVAVATFAADPGAENVMTSSDFNAAGRANINRTGTTQFKVYFTERTNGDSVKDSLGFYSGEAIQTKRPKLIIECSVN
ncbi:MAG: hypothetical protein DRP65_01385 [Planctomycetota bacterium]|nr:MAG: hypothetical protein DRP65_01385 [Planctomycetota bacterium]